MKSFTFIGQFTLLLACVASRTTRTKFGPREIGFRMRAARKMGARAKRRKERGGHGERFPPFPSPTPLLPLFCSRLIYRAARMRKNSFARPEFRSRGTGTIATQATLLFTFAHPTRFFIDLISLGQFSL